MNKQLRQQVYEKFNGLCAYTGKPLDDNWQVDHITSKYQIKYNAAKEVARQKDWNDYQDTIKQIDNIENLFPAISFVNHYKRSYDLEGFKGYLKDFHKRLAKLPKTTKRPDTVKRIAYMNTIANLFDITIDKPFSGKFYFETINTKK